MKKTEIFLIFVIIIGLVLKTFHIPGNSAILIISFSALSCFYMYFGFAYFNKIPIRKVFKNNSYKNINRKRIFGAIVTGYSLSAILIGILFSIQDWPGAGPILLNGMICSFLIVVLSTIKYIKREEPFYLEIIYRSLIANTIALIIFIT